MGDNFTHYESCTCLSHPPCSFCVNTFLCERCGNRNYSEDVTETKFGLECLDCVADPGNPAMDRINAQIDADTEFMDVTLCLKIAKLMRTLNDQLIDLQYGRGYKEEFMDNLLLEVEKI